MKSIFVLLMDIKERRQGIEMSLDNARNLSQSAQILAAVNKFSPAIPLLILSTEELIKSYALCLEFVLGNSSAVKEIIKGSKHKYSRSYMFVHTEKHELIKAILKDLNDVPIVVRLILKMLPPPLTKITALIELPEGSRTKIMKLINDIDKFNDQKNSSLYVDYSLNRWRTPLSLTFID